jgi:hypothetical protein
MALERFAPIIIPVFDGSKERRNGPRTSNHGKNHKTQNKFKIKNNTNDDHVTHQNSANSAVLNNEAVHITTHDNVLLALRRLRLRLAIYF